MQSNSMRSSGGSKRCVVTNSKLSLPGRADPSGFLRAMPALIAASRGSLQSLSRERDLARMAGRAKGSKRLSI